MLKAIHAQEDRAAARQKAVQVAAKLKEMHLCPNWTQVNHQNSNGLDNSRATPSGWLCESETPLENATTKELRS